MLDGPLVALIVLAVGGALAAAYFFVEHRRHRRDPSHERTREAERLPLFGTDMLATRGEDGTLHTAADRDAPNRPAVRRVPTISRPANAAVPVYPGTSPNGSSNGAGHGYPAPGVGYAPPLGLGYPMPSAAPIGAVGSTNGSAAAPADAALVNGETLRFSIPDEGTLRFLPGRLEVSAGPDAGREVRFVAPPSGGDVEVTFGRTEGPAYRHVQLLARTVSRRHATMCLTDDHWSLKNLSATNPVILNGRSLAADEVAPLLVDGDRIEMGEVVFTFYNR